MVGLLMVSISRAACAEELTVPWLRLAHKEVEHLAFSPDDGLLATAGANQVYLWRTEDGSCVRHLDGHAKVQDGIRCRITGIAFLKDGKKLLTAGWDGNVMIWDVSSGAALRTVSQPFVFALTDEGQRHFQLVQRVPTSALAVSPDGKYFAASFERTIQVWEVSTQRPVMQLGERPRTETIKLSDLATTVPSHHYQGSAERFLLNYFAISGYEDESSEHFPDLECWKSVHRDAAIHLLSFTADGKFLLAATAHTTEVWSLAEKRVAHKLEGSSRFSVSPDGLRVTGGSLFNCQSIWELPSFRTIKDLPIRGGYAVWSMDGSHLLLCNDDNPTLHVIDAFSDRILEDHEVDLPFGQVRTFALSPSNRFLAVATANDDARFVIVRRFDLAKEFAQKGPHLQEKKWK